MVQSYKDVPKNFRPMLAGTLDPESYGLLQFPVYTSVKIDGIRCSIHSKLGPVTRSLKSLPNLATRQGLNIQRLTYPEFNGVDGELTWGSPENVTDPDIFNKSQSAFMSSDGHPIATYWMFDHITEPYLDSPFTDRYTYMQDKLRFLTTPKSHTVASQLIHYRLLPQSYVNNLEELKLQEALAVEFGYEGLMVRHPLRPYKYNRSATTKAQQHLMKMKDFVDAEAKVIGFEELMHNDNEQQEDNFGLAKRSSHKENKRPGNTLGKLVVTVTTGRFSGVQCRIGSGFDHATKQRIWDSKLDYLGKTVTFKYQDHGSKDAPRIPIFKGFRYD